MSLFNVCNWWTAQTSDLEENYDVASLLCARFGLEDTEKDYVVVGSHAGNLSIFYPHLEHNRRMEENGFKPTDLLLEVQLKAPIVGLYAGRFSGANASDVQSNQLAVLHPNAVVIYKLQTLGGVAEHGLQLRLHTVAEYQFERVALALCKGNFGRVKGREFFCITHMDGTLTFHEQDGILYECQFPGHRALPQPVIYCERTDSFLRFTAGWNLECFTYQDMSHSSMNKSHYQAVWSVCLGEGVIDMCVIQVKSDMASIMILGERNFICLHDNGIVDFILKLDYTPKCFHSFVVGYYWEPGARLITAIVSDTARLTIYESANIIWAAQFKESTPVAIQRSNLNGLPGGIVTLSATGQLRIGYLGSDPYIFKVPPINMEEVSFTQAHKELLQLEEEIKAAVDVQDMSEIDRRAHEDVRLTFSINQQLSEDSDALLLDVSAHVLVKDLPSCTGRLKIKSRIELAELQLVLNVPDGMRCSQEPLTYVDLPAGWTESFELDFYVADLLHIHTARIEAIISFIDTRGIPRVVQQFAYMPLSMFYKSRQPLKNASIKLTYNITSKSLAPKLATFFPEFVNEDSETQALGLLLLCPGDEKCEEIITIVTAKNSNRLRIQSDQLETFPLILERLLKVARDAEPLQKPSKSKHQKNKIIINPVIKTIMASAVLPIQNILHRIDLHNETQENIRKQTLELDELWQQFKTLQRQLQEKSEDESKESLVMKIEENYDHLIAEGDKLMEMRKTERKHRCDLTCAIYSTTCIINALQLEEKIVNIVCAVLCTPIEDWTELSWEQTMCTGIDMLYHYGPLNRLKTSSTSNNVLDTNSSYESFDYNRFRKHFLTVLERIQRLADMKLELPPEPPQVDNKTLEGKALDISGLSELLDVSTVDSKGNAVMGKRMIKHRTLEAVEDDEEEYDEEDLRKVGYKKDYGSQETKNKENSEWVNENYELPSSEELFSDLGIWW